jgi:hypothetical protein
LVLNNEICSYSSCIKMHLPCPKTFFCLIDEYLSQIVSIFALSGYSKEKRRLDNLDVLWFVNKMYLQNKTLNDLQLQQKRSSFERIQRGRNMLWDFIYCFFVHFYSVTFWESLFFFSEEITIENSSFVIW